VNDPLDPEVAVLACCLINRHAIWTAIEEGVRTEDFSRPTHRLIWGTMRQLVEVDQVPSLDPIVLAGALTDDMLRDVGGRTYLHALASSVPAVSLLREYCQLVRRAALGSRLRDLTKRLTDEIEKRPDSPEALLEEYQEQLAELALGFEGRRGSVPVGSAGEAVLAELEFPSRGLMRTPWGGINEITNGLQPGSLTVIAGETSHGKSAAALQIVDHAANQGFKSLYVSAEMSTEELFIRLAKIYGFDSACYYGRRAATEVDKQRVTRLLEDEKYHERIMVMDDLWDVGQLMTEVRRRKPDLLVLDYLQLLVDPGGDRTEATSAFSRLCKKMAAQYQIPVIILSQLRKQSAQEWRSPSLKTLNLDRIRDSGAPAQDADVVLFVYRKLDAETNVLLDDGGILVVKSRNGVTGHFPMVFDGGRQRFMETYDGGGY